LSYKKILYGRCKKKKRDENKIVSPEFTPTKSEKTGAALKVSLNKHGLIFGNIFSLHLVCFYTQAPGKPFYCRIKLREEELPAWALWSTTPQEYRFQSPICHKRCFIVDFSSNYWTKVQPSNNLWRCYNDSFLFRVTAGCSGHIRRKGR